jgi:hypothetical protein
MLIVSYYFTRGAHLKKKGLFEVYKTIKAYLSNTGFLTYLFIVQGLKV